MSETPSDTCSSRVPICHGVWRCCFFKRSWGTGHCHYSEKESSAYGSILFASRTKLYPEASCKEGTKWLGFSLDIISVCRGTGAWGRGQKWCSENDITWYTKSTREASRVQEQPGFCLLVCLFILCRSPSAWSPYAQWGSQLPSVFLPVDALVVED